MGGAIAQEIALAAPERVRTLTLAVTFAGRRRLGAQARRGLGRARAQDLDEQHVDELMLLNLSERSSRTRAWSRSCAT